MLVSEIRNSFIEYFKSKNHKFYKSASLIPVRDKTLLFTSAGMVPFKPYFLGVDKPDNPTAVSCQKCFRTTDIEQVGQTARHHTFFEMLGNFSFGDYFKKEAIDYAWEYFTEILKLDKEKLYVTVYKDDDESYQIWKDDIGIPEKRIYKLGKKDNFWSMGETGPCGPCSEILYDQGPEFSCGKDDCKVGCDCDRYLEIWNLVFTQFDKQSDGELLPLPQKNIDTGMGLERLAVILQKKSSNFEIDNIFPIIQLAEQLSKKKYNTNKNNDISFRVIADHTRAMMFLISDGVLPSNEGTGYVLRRLIRRCLNHLTKLGIELDGTILNSFIPVIFDLYAGFYTNLNDSEKVISNIIKLEENSYINTISKGINKFYSIIGNNEKVISGKEIFILYDTYGLPLDIAEEILEEEGLTYDKGEFEKYMNEQKNRSRESWDKAVTGFNIPIELLKNTNSTEFTGYETTESDTKVELLIRDSKAIEKVTDDNEFILICSTTPMYGESGGQIGDTGFIYDGDTQIGIIKDTQWISEKIVGHLCKLVSGKSINKNDTIKIKVDKKRRTDIERNHTATHLLQAALRKRFGSQVKQAGSYVAPDRLRFDFTVFDDIKDDDVFFVEQTVNEYIDKDYTVTKYFDTYDNAVKSGVTAIFTEKYADDVRVVKIDGISSELCGGTHLDKTGIIHSFVITDVSAVGSGIKRIEALTGFNAYEYLKNLSMLMKKSTNILKIKSDDLPDRIEKLINDKKEFEKKIRDLINKGSSISEPVQEKEFKINNLNIYLAIFKDIESQMLRKMSDKLIQKYDLLFITGQSDKKNGFILKTKNDSGISCKELFNNINQELPLKGGGNDQIVQGACTGKIDLEKVESVIKKNINE